MTTRIGIVIIVSSGILSGCSLPRLGTSSTSPATDASAATAETANPGVTPALVTAAPTTFDEPIAATLEVTQGKAKAWQSDASLHYVSVELPADLAVNAATTTYVFGSAKAADDWWTYSLNEQSAKSIRASIPKADYLGSSIVPINSAYWKMNYVEAFQLADANGGATFRADHPETRVTLYLSHRAPNQWLWWTVQYQGAASTLLTLLVNPNQGEVLDSAGTQLIAPPTGTPAAGAASSTPLGSPGSTTVQ